MPRAATTTDVFNAIAEPRRREIIDFLAGHEQDVSKLVAALRISQSAVSKHLGVLRKVGIVSVNKHGRRRLYRLNPQELRPVHEWVKTFERFWINQLDRIRERAERRTKQQASDNHPPFDRKGE
jgi:DNA-binding transcriptional ArsR family regulator